MHLTSTRVQCTCMVSYINSIVLFCCLRQNTTSTSQLLSFGLYFSSVSCFVVRKSSDFSHVAVGMSSVEMLDADRSRAETIPCDWFIIRSRDGINCFWLLILSVFWNGMSVDLINVIISIDSIITYSLIKVIKKNICAKFTQLWYKLSSFKF